MAIHPDLKSLIRESLPEYLHVAEYCVSFHKDSSWPENQREGCLGYPAAAMLFSIVDTIGSFHRGRDDVKILVDGKCRQICGDGFEHFFILNSDYYGQGLGESEIKKLYSNYRNLLIHNASLAPEHFLIKPPNNAQPFPAVNRRLMVNVSGFLQISRGAVARFLARLDDVVPGSRQADNIGLKR